MAAKEITLADVMSALKAQGEVQHAELQAVTSSVDRVFKEVMGLVKEECSRVKDEVLSEVFTKDQVKGEVEKAASELRRYVDEVVATQAPPVLSQHKGTLFRSSGRASETSVKSYPSAASSTSRRLKDGMRRRPQELDGTVSWEAYKTQFELLASARQWSRPEMAMQLVWALKRPALEVLNQLPAAQRCSYSKVTATLERRYGYQHQTEVFRTRFRARLRGPGETLTRLAQDLEVLVRRAYPEASEEMITILLRDQFVDAIDNQQLRIYVQQAHPKDLQEALAKGLEMESFLRTTRERPSGNYVPQRVKAKKGAVQKAYSSPSPPLGEFRGKCYSCGHQGHTKRYCLQGLSSRKAVNGRQGGWGKRKEAGGRGRAPAREPETPVRLSCRAEGARTVQVGGQVDGKSCCLTVDSGAERTFVQDGVVATGQPPVAQQQLCGITGHCTQLRGPVHARIAVGSTEEHLPVFVADVGENLLGLDYLKQSRAVLDFGEMTMSVRGSVVPLQEGGVDAEECEASIETHRAHTASLPEASHRCRLSKEQKEESQGSEECEGVQTTMDPEGHCEDMQGSSTGVPPHLQDLLQRSSACLSGEQVDEVKEVLTLYADVFSQGDNDLGRTSLVKHRIHTGDSRPVKLPPRRIAPARRLEVEKAVEELRAQGIIEKSASPWSAAVVLVKKKDGSTRCCVDYRGLNAVTTKDSYPLPRVDDTLDAFTGAQWFSTLDLKSGYHQVEVAEEDREKTAFSYGQGLYQFKVMSFGLVNAPATFERLMERVLDGLL
ncbi:uncharacterized protein LOC135108633 [Scylla paramamosain]|uniref:uncharacterized protein LOC135108633 n=1 Tax=Scylla paramamosain TaxID=85552 RepID=UPI003082E8B5